MLNINLSNFVKITDDDVEIEHESQNQQVIQNIIYGVSRKYI